jgi:hypothetical protein
MVSKNVLFEPFIHSNNDHFTNTGSGQAKGNLKKRVVFP